MVSVYQHISMLYNERTKMVEQDALLLKFIKHMQFDE